MLMKSYITVSGSKLSNVIAAWKWIRDISLSESLTENVKDPKVRSLDLKHPYQQPFLFACASTKIQYLDPPNRSRFLY